MLEGDLFFFCGKGGVGKTTLSSAFSLLLSSAGKRVLLISTDPAHSLSDVFERRIGAEAVEVAENLFACEIDPSLELKRYTDKVLSSAREIVNPELFRKMVSLIKGLSGAPGAEESALLNTLSERIPIYLREFEALVVDTAPTGHTLRLIRSAIRAGEWLEELLKQRREVERLRAAAGTAQRDRVLEILRERKRSLSELLRILFRTGTLFVPVLTAEKLSILETERMVGELEESGIRISALFVNRILPPHIGDDFLRKRKEREMKYLEYIADRFSRYRIVTVSLREGDVRGLSDLRDLAQELGERIR